MTLLYLWLSLYTIRRIRDRFQIDEALPVAVALLLASIAVTVAVIVAAQLWGAGVEIVRVGSDNLLAIVEDFRRSPRTAAAEMQFLACRELGLDDRGAERLQVYRCVRSPIRPLVVPTQDGCPRCSRKSSRDPQLRP